jgi:hypothetical protein
MNAIALLGEEHEVIALLLREIESGSGSDGTHQRYILRRVASLIETHMLIEEEIFYAAFHGAAQDDRDELLFFEALEEHHAIAQVMLPDVMRTGPGAAAFAGRLKALREQLEHHFAEEEEEMFPRMRQLMSDAELEALGQKMAKRRAEIGLVG